MAYEQGLAVVPETLAPVHSLAALGELSAAAVKLCSSCEPVQSLAVQ